MAAGAAGWSGFLPLTAAGTDRRRPAGARCSGSAQGLYQSLVQSQGVPVPWSGDLLDRIEAERCRRLPRENLAERQECRDRPLMALANHIAETDRSRHLVVLQARVQSRG
jgi:hypothetical protein